MKIKAIIFLLALSLFSLSGCVTSLGPGYDYGGYYPPARPYYYGRPYYAPRPVIVTRPYYRSVYHGNNGGRRGGDGGYRGGGSRGGSYSGGR